jgi:multidrug efflux pump subunit AcrA (membrane-fusion protein)
MKLAGLLLVVIMVMGGIGYWYYNDTQARMAILQENNAQLSVAVATNEETIASLQADYARAQEETQRINAAYTEIRRQNSRLSDRLSEIDLSLLAAEKPDSIERAVNRGTVNAGRCFEILSGSPLTETELNATDGESFNKECPWLWPSLNTSGVQQPTAPAN